MQTMTYDLTNNAKEAFQRLDGVASEQNGLVTRSQARNRGVGDVALHRLVKQGLLAKEDTGVYRLPGAPNTGLGQLYLSWLRFDPEAEPHERLARPKAVVVGGTASWVWECGDLQEYPYEFALEKPYRTHRAYPELITAVGLPGPNDTAIHKGIAVTTMERTVQDLVTAGHDGDHIGRVIRDAIESGRTTMSALGNRLERVRPDGFRNGRAYVEHLVALAV